MQELLVKGNTVISGEIDVHGAKNSALPLLAASILVNGETTFHNCPWLSDVFAATRILAHLGCKCIREKDSITLNTDSLQKSEIPDDMMREMRSSIIFLGALLGRMGKCRVSFPGGCELGARPIDIHIASLRQMGAVINEEYGYIDCFVPEKLKGSKIILSFPSVGATENIILAAVLAQGETEICNAAREPEIVDLCEYLNACGAKITNYGESSIHITGVEKLKGCEYSVMPDRIVAATYLCAAAITGGEIIVSKVRPHDLDAVFPILNEMGCSMYSNDSKIYLKAPNVLKSVDTIRTMPYPGFPTDLQAIFMACLCKARGTSVIVENIFESRYKYAGELRRMGADIKIEGRVAIIEGTDKLYGTTVKATDLRGGAALVLAGLTTDTITHITDIKHIDRGYECIEKNFNSIGAKIQRI